MVELTIRVPPAVDRVSAFGPAERNLKMIRETLGVNIASRDDVVKVRGEGPAAEAARRVIDRLITAGENGHDVSRQLVLDAIAEEGSQAEQANEVAAVFADERRDPEGWHAPAIRRDRERDWLDVYSSGRPVIAKTDNQRHYLDSIRTHDLVLCLGPAGTGKTYLAVAAAIHMLKSGRVKKAVLARPAVEAGEKLGFLPGDQFAKVNPYLRPLLDALHDMMDYATIKRFMASDIIEVVPLAFMRGRTLNDAIIILDEAQNTTRVQMQMFLTRMGQRSKMIVTGDTTQIDLPDPKESGLIDAARRLRRTPGIAFCALERSDVVRHELVQRIIDAYSGSPDETKVSPLDEAMRAAAQAERTPRLKLKSDGAAEASNA